ncbi:hypothetical protein EI427_23450 [Flammeovirga pectinis]|uniref:Uncharacterized protein n=1 Tax=Flammeovirga pectinis TaxID=2494373 RepID=A0A3S9PAT2_9BACT|nr:hypothetical protein [Flammeovirga pectinis]AZQ65172.1 hypothetical protein EI427_23450 [Flammeovirga pectinis]
MYQLSKKYLLVLIGVLIVTSTTLLATEIPIEDIKRLENKITSTKQFKKFRAFDVEVPSFKSEKKLTEKPLKIKTQAMRDIDAQEAKILLAYETVNAGDLFVNVFTEDELVSLPVGIKKTIKGKDFIIIIDNVRLTPKGAFVNVGLVVNFTKSNKKLVFGAFDVAFSQEKGFGGLGKLALLKDYSLALTKNINLEFKGLLSGGENYVNWNCDGYESMAAEFDIVFDSTLIRPANASGDVIKGKKVVSSVKTTIVSLDEMLVKVNLPRFRMGETNDRGFVFCAQDVIYDQSEVSNGNVIFPDNYHSADFLEGNLNLWKGFYIRRAEVIMPSDFDKIRQSQVARDSAEAKKGIKITADEREERNVSDSLALEGVNQNRTRIQVTGLIIDNNGLTGNFQGHYLLSLDKGKIGGGWAISLDRVEVDILKGQFIMADLRGDLQIPTSDSVGVLSYEAQIESGGDFRFYSSTEETLPFAPLGERSKLILTRTEITIEITDGIFYAGVDVDGSMDVGAKESDVELVGITFQSLLIETRQPYLSAVAFSVSSEALEQKLSGRNLTINEIGISAIGGSVELKVDAMVHLHDKLEGFGGGGAVKVIGFRDENGWGYNRTEVSKISIEIVKKDTYDIRGTISILNDDPIYGDVFMGTVEAKLGPLTKSGGLGAAATIMFGKKDGNSYWYVDALVILPDPGLQVGSFSFLGFGGGLYYGMERATYANNVNKASLVKSATGGVYLPNAKVGLGLKAIIVFAVPDKGTLLAETTFEMSFFKGGGIQKAIFVGCANIMSSTMSGLSDDSLTNLVAKEDASPTEIQNDQDVENASYECAYIQAESSPIFASLVVSLDFENNIYHGELIVSVEAGVMEGFGKAVVHFEEDTWYVHIGTSKNPISLTMLGSFSATAYFMFGDNLPSGFKAPQQVIDILGYEPGAPITGGRQEEALAGGRGVAFGASLDLDTSELEFLMFYAHLQAGFGFDLMLKSYGPNTVCANTGNRIGLNGWYAQGQIYTYIKAKIGVKVDLWFVSGKFEILDAAFAALLQFKGPNPIYAFGVVGGRFNILGGAVKGQCSFEFTLGEECKISGASPLGGVEIIATITPVEGSKEVDVFTSPQVVFNVPIDQEMELIDPNLNQKKSYIIHIKDISLRSKSNDKEEVCEMIWNDEHTTLLLQPQNMLQNEAQYEFSISLDFREKKNGEWVVVNSNDVLRRSVKFKSGKRPDYIDPQHVVYAYPVERQMNFYIEETPRGYLDMRQGDWGYLFEVSDPNKWEVKARFTSFDNSISYGNVEYNNAKKKVSFDIPSDMQTNKVYTLDLVHIPKATFNIDENVINNNNQVSLNKEKGNISSVEVTKRTTTEKNIESSEDKIVYTSTFRSSHFRTFVAKMNGINVGTGLTGILPYNFRRQMSVYIPTFHNETLDKLEVIGEGETAPLISLEADFTDTFFQNVINPLMYTSYPLHGAKISWRKENEGFGWVKPKYSTYFASNSEGAIMLSDDELSSGNLEAHHRFRIIYNTDYYVGMDFRDFQAELEDLSEQGNLNLTDPQDIEITNFIRTNVAAPFLFEGIYHVIMNYTLPGKTTPNSIHKLRLKNIIQ